MGGCLATTYNIACSRPHTDLQRNQVSNLEPSSPEAEILPQGHGPDST
ncbi:hypothetical protein AVEN_237158-1, partial [Araneus ventricosus]